jgi:hypothetical protein
MGVIDADKSILDSFVLIHQLMDTHDRVSMAFHQIKMRNIQMAHMKEALVKGGLKQVPKVKSSVHVISYFKNSSRRTS